MALLLDTHILVWIGTDDDRLSASARNAIEDIANPIFVSAVIAFEFADLHRRGRLGKISGLEQILARIEGSILPLPADSWRLVEMLPMLHRDPIDRMLVAHALHADLTLVSADAYIRDYPVRTLW